MVNGSQYAYKDDSRQNIIQSIKTVFPELSISAVRKSPLANNYSEISPNISPPIHLVNFISTTLSSRFRD